MCYNTHGFGLARVVGMVWGPSRASRTEPVQGQGCSVCQAASRGSPLLMPSKSLCN